MINDGVIVIDDVVYQPIQDALEQMFTAPDLAWSYNPSSLYIKGNNSTPDFPQTSNTFDTPLFTHMVAVDNQKLTTAYDLLMPVIHALPITVSQIRRLKANLTLPARGAQQNSHHPVHVDSDVPNLLTAIYYVNDSDGDTFIFNEKTGHQGNLTIKRRISPKKGRIVLFDGQLLHAGGIPLHYPRIVVNINIT